MNLKFSPKKAHNDLQCFVLRIGVNDFFVNVYGKGDCNMLVKIKKMS